MMSTTSEDILRKMDLLDKMQTDITVVIDSVKSHVTNILDEYYGVKKDANSNRDSGEPNGSKTTGNSESSQDSTLPDGSAFNDRDIR